MNRRQFLGSAIASAFGIALAPLPAGAISLPITIEGDDYERYCGQAAFDFLRRVGGWDKFVANNIAVVRFDYISGDNMERNRYGSRCLVRLPRQIAANAGTVASLLVHEATHQFLFNHGIGYESPHYERFPYDGQVRPWQLQEFVASCVEQAFRECAGLSGDVFRRTEVLL